MGWWERRADVRAYHDDIELGIIQLPVHALELGADSLHLFR